MKNNQLHVTNGIIGQTFRAVTNISSTGQQNEVQVLDKVQIVGTNGAFGNAATRDQYLVMISDVGELCGKTLLINPQDFIELIHTQQGLYK